MKKLFIFVVIASLTMLSADAFDGRQDVVMPHQSRSLTRVVLPDNAQEMKKHTLAESATVPVKGSNENMPYYKRPAGAFFSPFIAVNGCGLNSYGDYSFLLVKPYSDYTYRAENVGNYYYFWVDDSSGYFTEDENREHTIIYDVLEKEAPILWFSRERDEYENYCYFQYPAFYSNSTGGVMPGDDVNPIASDEGSHLMVVPAVNSAMLENDSVEFLLSSKTMVEDGASSVDLTRYTGVEPYGTNKYGWWFGKNSGHIDGMAQAFEKPTHPYLLTKVFLQTGVDLRVKEDVTMTCRVYKLDDIPAYVPGGSAVLPEVPGELVVFGEALVTPRTAEDKNGLIEFTLFGWDEDDPSLTFEYTPTIDYPILICIDGYNDPEMENLEEFSAFISSNYNTDEGYGELAYLKYPIYEVELDENGDTIRDSRGRPITSFKGNYCWRGLNNFFEGPMEMKTGLTIFIAADRPYLAFNRFFDDIGVYEFDENGGEMVRIVDGETFRGIEFKAWVPSCDDDWTVTRKGDDELPDWLDVELIDGADENGEFNNIVTAHVTADPLPNGVKYREAVIRFAFPGAYLDYRFIQGTKSFPPEPPCFPDGEINISHINYIINLILNDMYDYCGDVNQDGEVNISDVNAIINIILWE